ncbi:hypothetical protein AWJ14_12985 [Hoeflea olei]|uniref:Uncharacterized protein n=1 Tax=Hoeflea olei TaxID=1480615 RepID=A0A1C1YRK7_9HYPH|nr:hypothetical protein AWJ14_12985 [Hoeflea olei]
MLTVSRQQAIEKAACYQAVNTDAQAAGFSRCRQACGFHSILKVVDAGCHAFDKIASSFRQANAAGIALEERSAKLIFQRLYASADT